MSALPTFSMKELIEAGVHFGHKTKRWNPRMAPYIYGARNDIHIIDLQQTVPMLYRALTAVRTTVAKNGRILFVGTKRQASEEIAAAAKRCGQYYVDNRWLGGMLTNWSTIQNSIRQLRKYEEVLAEGANSGLTKKELLQAQRNRDKLDRSLGGIRDMGGKPDLLFVIDTNREDLAIKEAQKLGIPIVAIVDTNCTTEGITYPIPGNDDATRAIKLYCKLISDAALSGLKENLTVDGAEKEFAANDKSSEVAEAVAKEEKAAAKPARQEKTRGGKAKEQPFKAAPETSTKKEAFAKEAKKAAAKKSEDVAEEATTDEATAKKSKKKSA